MAADFVEPDEADNDLIAQQLEDACAELRNLNQLVADVPALMEDRFRRELSQLLQFNQQLQVEHTQLSGELRKLAAQPLQPPRSQPLLPPLGAASPRRRPKRKRSADGAVVPRACKQRSRPKALGWPLILGLVVCGGGLLWLQPWRSPLRITAGVSSVPGGIEAKSQPLSSPQAPSQSPLSQTVDGDAQSLVELDAEQPSWIEVHDRDGQLLLTDTLQPGQPRVVRLRSGLEVFAARPEFLRFRIDQGVWQRFDPRLLSKGMIVLEPRMDSPASASTSRQASEGNR